MAKKKWKPATLARRAFFFIVGSLLIGLFIIFFERLLSWYLPKHFSVSLGVGLAVAAGLWLMTGIVLNALGVPYRAINIMPG